ncbi:MAG: tetratricopeptide repeat protein [bacterium]
MKKIIFISLLLSSFFLTGCLNKNKNKINPENITKTEHVKIFKTNLLPKEAKILLNEGIKKLQSNNIKDAILAFRDLTGLYPKLAVAHYNLGLAYAKNNQLNNAVDSWEKAVIIDENYADAYFNLGIAYRIINNNKKAVENLTKYILLCPDDKNNILIKEEISKLREPVIGKGIIGRISITDKIDVKNNIALSAESFFKPNTPFIYVCIELVNAPKNTQIDANWHYKTLDNQSMLVNSLKFKTQESKNILLSLKKPETNWPIGKYNFELLINNKENTIVPFYIQQ